MIIRRNGEELEKRTVREGETVCIPMALMDGAASGVDAQSIRDEAYEYFVRDLNGGGRLQFVDKLPDRFDAFPFDKPKIYMAIGDIETEEPSRAQAGITQLLNVARMLHARASTAANSEERAQAEKAADYCEGLAAAAEIVMKGFAEKPNNDASGRIN